MQKGKKKPTTLSHEICFITLSEVCSYFLMFYSVSCTFIFTTLLSINIVWNHPKIKKSPLDLLKKIRFLSLVFIDFKMQIFKKTLFKWSLTFSYGVRDSEICLSKNDYYCFNTNGRQYCTIFTFSWHVCLII